MDKRVPRRGVFVHGATFCGGRLARARSGGAATGAQIVGVCVAFVGIVVAFLGPAWFGGAVEMPSSRWLWGDAMVLCAGLCFAAVNLIVRTTALADAPPAQTLFYQLVGGSLLAVPAVFLTGQYRFEPSALSLGSMVYQTVGITFFSYLAWFALFQRYSVNRLSVLTFLTPVFGVLLGVLLLGEQLAPLLSSVPPWYSQAWRW